MMNQDKLDGLYALATDERTPDEERRSAAVLYLKHAPRWRSPTKEELAAVITKDVVLKHLGPELEERERKLREAQAAADGAKARAEKAESDLRELKEALWAKRAADEKLNRLLGATEQAEKVKPKRSPYESVFDPWLNNGGSLWPK